MNTDAIQQPELGLPDTNPITRVEEYRFEPIQGYPMLNWQGKRPFTSTQYYPAQHKETYGPEVNGWRNKIYWGDNLQVMSHLLREYRGKVKLVYIDPPFDSKADYKRTIQVKGKIATSDQGVFEEKQYTDIWINDEYLQFMYERVILIRELLANDGSLYVHLDWRVGHYIKVILDEVFGNGNFHNDIRWIRSLPHNDPNQYGRFSDMILYYSLSERRLFNPQYIPQKEDSVESHYRTDSNGRRFRLASLLAPGGRGPRYPYKGFNKSWRFTQEKMLQLETEGRIYYKEGQMPSRIYYLDESLGSQVQDVWTDISPLNPMAIERTGYPTQKPEALLERIINASSNPEDIIFDCFMGSGTTQTVAMKLGRRFIGADINLGAIQITTKRLLHVATELAPQPQKLIPEEGQPSTLYTGFEVYNVNNYDIFRNPVQARDLLKEALEVNPLPHSSLFDGEKDGRMVKIMPINRIATRQDLNELINGFDNRAFQKRYDEHPNRPVERITLVCMGHEPDLAAHLKKEMAPFKLDVEVVDILRDKQNLQFKRDSEARIVIKDGYLVIEQFYPLNLLQKLSVQKEEVTVWRELVESVMVDWNYDGAVLQPAIIDVPEGNTLVAGRYKVPNDAGTICVKITDLLSESLEVEIAHA